MSVPEFEPLQLNDKPFSQDPLPVIIPDKVVEQENIKIFRIMGTVYNLDALGSPGTDLTNATLDQNISVPIKDDGDKILGSASFTVGKTEITADAFIDYATPERLSIENGDKYYLVPVAGIETVGGGFGRLQKGFKISISYLLLARVNPFDKRIWPVRPVN